MINQERITIFIDGGNFHHLVLKKFNTKELDFDFNAFVDFLVNGKKLSDEGAKRFYVEYVGFSIIDKINKSNTKPLETMFRYSDIQRVLTEADIKKFIK